MCRYYAVQKISPNSLRNTTIYSIISPLYPPLLSLLLPPFFARHHLNAIEIPQTSTHNLQQQRRHINFHQHFPPSSTLLILTFPIKKRTSAKTDAHAHHNYTRKTQIQLSLDLHCISIIASWFLSSFSLPLRWFKLSDYC